MQFDSTHASGTKTMLRRIHRLLAQADTVVTFNGMRFDLPVLNKEFLKHGLNPPAPYKQIDLYRVVRQSFKFESNKLDSLTNVLGLGRKVKHKGFKLWVDCMNDDAVAWTKMERYNKQDVLLLEKLYHRVRPWIRQHPQMTEDGLCCPKCGSTWANRRGVQLAVTRAYQRYQCKRCGGWFRSNQPLITDREERGVNI